MQSKKTRVYLTAKTMEIIGDREPSVVINQSIMRIGIAGENEKITEPMREVVKKHTKGRRNPYPDQSVALNEFAEKTFHTLSEAAVLMDKVEREI